MKKSKEDEEVLLPGHDTMYKHTHIEWNLVKSKERRQDKAKVKLSHYVYVHLCTNTHCINTLKKSSLKERMSKNENDTHLAELNFHSYLGEWGVKWIIYCMHLIGWMWSNATGSVSDLDSIGQSQGWTRPCLIWWSHSSSTANAS